MKVGDKVPNSRVFLRKDMDSETETLNFRDFIAGKKVAMFGLPGAFTPTCSKKHVPSFLENYDALKAKGYDLIVCVSVNDPFVMARWALDLGVGDKIAMIADGNGEFTKDAGLEIDRSTGGMGIRSKRYAATVDADGTVLSLDIEESGKYEVSSAECLLAKSGI